MRFSVCGKNLELYAVAYRRLKFQYVVALMVVTNLYSVDGFITVFEYNVIIAYQFLRHSDTLLYLTARSHGHTDGVIKVGIKCKSEL